MKSILATLLILGFSSFANSSVIKCENELYQMTMETPKKAYDADTLSIPTFKGTQLTLTEKKSGNVFKTKNVSLSHDGGGNFTWQVFAKSDVISKGFVSVITMHSDHEEDSIRLNININESILSDLSYEDGAPEWLRHVKSDWKVNTQFKRDEGTCNL